MATVSNLLQQMKDTPFLPWSKVEDAIHASAFTKDAAAALHLILAEIEHHHQQDVERVKQLIEERALHYESLVARLQYLEANRANCEEVEGTAPVSVKKRRAGAIGPNHRMLKAPIGAKTTGKLTPKSFRLTHPSHSSDSKFPDQSQSSPLRLR
jgi:hypothetical protein